MLESKRLKVNLRKIKVMVCGVEGKMRKSKIDPGAKCGQRVMANLILYSKCGK